MAAAFMLALARLGPAPNLTGLAPVDVANLTEVLIAAVRAKLAAGRRAILDTERELDSELAGRIFDLIQEYDIAADVAVAER